MSLRIRLDRSPDDRAHVDRLWHASLAERCTAEQLATMTLPSVNNYPTVRCILVENPDSRHIEDVIAMAASILPGVHARYGFEARTGFPCDSLPTTDRTQLGTGLTLCVRPSWRRSGLGGLLAFASLALVWAAGGGYMAAENGGTSLAMAKAAGYRDTGLVTMERNQVPYHLTVGVVRDVMNASWLTVQRLLGDYQYDEEMGDILASWRASRQDW